jgi:phosphoglycolate phosphatase
MRRVLTAAVELLRCFALEYQMPVELIIFDLDGTLIDSSVDIANAINYAVEPYGISPVTVEETIGLIGEGITRLMEKLMERSRNPEGRSRNKGQDPHMMTGDTSIPIVDRETITKRFLDHYSSHLIDNTTAYPGVRDTLQALKGFKKAVISNKREELSTRVLRDLGLLHYLDLIVGSDTTPERKPSPVPINHVLKKLDVSPDRAAIVGDSNYDIEAGKAAHILTIGVTYGYRSVDFLEGADFIIDRMPELLDIVHKVRRSENEGRPGQ